LRLFPEQTQRMESILDETQHEFSQLHLAVKPQFEEIRQIPREEQEQDYQAMIRERHEPRVTGKRDGLPISDQETTRWVTTRNWLSDFARYSD
jgi:hypothetical protein